MTFPIDELGILSHLNPFLPYVCFVSGLFVTATEMTRTGKARQNVQCVYRWIDTSRHTIFPFLHLLVLVRLTTDMMEHHDQMQAGEERVNLTYTSTS